MFELCYVNTFCTKQNKSLYMLDDPGRVKSQTISVVYQIQWFNFDYNLVMTRKVIIRTSPGLDLNPR